MSGAPKYLHLGDRIIDANTVHGLQRYEAKPTRTRPDGKYGGTVTDEAEPVAVVLYVPHGVINLEGNLAERVWDYFLKQSDSQCIPFKLAVAEELGRQ